MATHSLPELDRRLLEERGAFVQTAEALRRRFRREIRDLAPRQQIKRHPGAALAVAAVVGLVAGRIAGGLLAAVFQ